MCLLGTLFLPCHLPLPRPSLGDALRAGDGLLSWLSLLPLSQLLPVQSSPEVPTGEGLRNLIEGATREKERGGGEEE